MRVYTQELLTACEERRIPKIQWVDLSWEASQGLIALRLLSLHPSYLDSKGLSLSGAKGFVGTNSGLACKTLDLITDLNCCKHLSGELCHLSLKFPQSGYFRCRGIQKCRVSPFCQSSIVRILSKMAQWTASVCLEYSKYLFESHNRARSQWERFC